MVQHTLHNEVVSPKEVHGITNGKMLYFAHGINAEAAGAILKDGKAVKWGYGGGSTPVEYTLVRLA